MKVSELKWLRLLGLAGRATAGLVIRASEVELVSMQGKRVVSHVRAPIASGVNEGLAQAIGRAVAEAGLRAKRVAVTVANQDVLIRSFTIPAIPKPEWEGAAQFEARKYVPFKMESLVWDFHVIPAPESKRGVAAAGVRHGVVFAGIPRETFRRIQEACAAAGVQATVIEPHSLSLARLVPGRKGEGPGSFVCLVDVEGDRAHLVIAREGAPFLTRDINLSGGVAVPAEGASASGEQGGRVQRLLSDLQVCMDFFTRENPSAGIERVILFGEQALVGPWCQELSERLQRPVELGRDVLIAHVEGAVSLSAAAAVGALRGPDCAAGADLDFLKRSVVNTAGSSRALLGRAQKTPQLLSSALRVSPQVVLPAVLAAGIVYGLFALVASQQVTQAQHALDQYLRARPEIGWGLDAIERDGLDFAGRQAEERLRWLRAALDERPGIAATLDALARMLPDGIWLTGLQFEEEIDPAGKSHPRLMVNGACFLGGDSEELAAIQEFEQRIKRHGTFLNSFGAAQLEKIDAEEDAVRRYTYRIFHLNCQSARRM